MKQNSEDNHRLQVIVSMERTISEEGIVGNETIETGYGVPRNDSEPDTALMPIGRNRVYSMDSHPSQTKENDRDISSSALLAK